MIRGLIDQKLIGPAALMGSNIVFLSNMFLSREHNANEDIRLVTFWFANILISLLCIMRSSNEASPRAPSSSRMDYVAVSIWGSAFTLIYSFLILYPDMITIPHLILAECLAPFLMIPFFKDAAAHANFRESKLALICCISILSFITLSMWDDESYDGFAKAWPFFLALIILYTASQAMARFLSTRRPASWAPIHVSLVASFGIGALVLSRISTQTIFEAIKNPWLWIIVPCMALMSLTNRTLFMIGLKKTPTVLSALLINATLPLSIILHAVESGNILMKSFIASIFYCIAATFFIYKIVASNSVGEAVIDVNSFAEKSSKEEVKASSSN